MYEDTRIDTRYTEYTTACILSIYCTQLTTLCSAHSTTVHNTVQVTYARISSIYCAQPTTLYSAHCSLRTTDYSTQCSNKLEVGCWGRSEQQSPKRTDHITYYQKLIASLIFALDHQSAVYNLSSATTQN